MGFFFKTHFRCNFFTAFHNTSASLITKNNAITEVRIKNKTYKKVNVKNKIMISNPKVLKAGNVIQTKWSCFRAERERKRTTNQKLVIIY